MCRRIILHSFTTHTSLVWLLFLRYLTLPPPATVHRCLRPSSARIHSSPVSTPDSHLIDLLFLFYVRIIVCGLDFRPRVFLSSSSLFSLTPESSSSLSHPSIHQSVRLVSSCPARAPVCFPWRRRVLSLCLHTYLALERTSASVSVRVMSRAARFGLRAGVVLSVSDLLHRKDSSLGGPWPHAISHCIAFVKTAKQCAPSSNTEY